MKTKYAYPLVILCLIASVLLQVIWLSQIFKAQQIRLKEDLDLAMGNAAKKTIYNSLMQETYPGSKYRDFFLSTEWLNLRMAFDNAHSDGLTKRFSFNITPDSAEVGLSLYFFKPQQDHIHLPINQIPISAKQQLDEKFSNNLMERRVDSLLSSMHLSGGHYYRLYNYSTGAYLGSNMPKSLNPAYVSAMYSYNLLHRKKYQLVVGSLNTALIYRMRLYLISSLLMILLTGATFYFILKLLRSQRLYAEARIAFTSNMTHELKTPVATVTLALESITKYKLSDDPVKLNEYLDISKLELQRLNLMIDKVLNLDQSEHGSVHIVNELYDVQIGIKQVIDNMQLQLAKSDATIVFKPAPEPCFVNGDPIHLTNVFYNLIENAVKYGGKGVNIVITCTHSNNRVEIIFKDNGPGIPPIDQARVFERFYRVQNKLNVHNVKGTGLGLYYVKQIIEKHNGRISLKSDFGKGSVFTINLPAA